MSLPEVQVASLEPHAERDDRGVQDWEERAAPLGKWTALVGTCSG